MAGPAVVVGAGGGIGRAVAQAFAADPQVPQVFALSRRRPPDWSPGERRAWLAVDILDEARLAEAAATIRGAGRPTRILIAAGRLHGDGLTPEKSLRALDRARLLAAYEANAIGPALAAKHLAPLMPRDEPAVLALLSARVGSLGDNRLGGWHGYRMAKAALNMLVRNLAIELGRTHPLAVCVALHPGTTATPLSAPFAAADRAAAPEATAQRLLAVMDGLSPEQSGGFFAYDGAPIPW